MSTSDAREAATLERLEEQIAWYDAKSIASQRAYKRLKGFVILAAASIPVVALLGFQGSAQLSAILGASIAAAEAMQQLNQYQQNWVSYRSACESLRHEKFLYLAGAGPYAKAGSPGVLLAERVESLVSQEHSKWSELRQEEQQPGEPTSGSG